MDVGKRRGGSVDRVSGTWLTEKRSILSKIVDYAHDIVHTKDIKDG